MTTTPPPEMSLNEALELARTWKSENDPTDVDGALRVLAAELDALPRCKAVLRDWRGDVIGPCIHHRKHSGECEL